MSALETGLAFLPFSVTMGIASGVVGRLPDRSTRGCRSAPGS